MKKSKVLEKTPFQHTSELPDCVISHIFSKLRMKDLVKTRTLSKRWLNEWGSSMDLNFDVDNMFDDIAPREFDSFLNSSDGSLESFQLFDGFQSEFVRRVDRFMLRYYQGAKIHSLRLDFPLGNEHNDIIDGWISQGIAKGVERIELLFSNKTVTRLWGIKPYKFSRTALLESDSLQYLHLQNCLLVLPIDFSRFKILRTLGLHQVVVEQDLLLGLFSSCIHLVDLTLNDCKFNSDLNITNQTVRHLNIVVNKHPPWKIDICALNLSSFEYKSNGGTRTISIEAPLLSKISCNCLRMPPIEFSGLKNLRMIVLDLLLVPHNLLPSLFSECLQLEDLTFVDCIFMSDINIISPTLRHLNILGCGSVHHLPLKINIDTLNLSSFEYRGHLRITSIKAPRLLKFYWDATTNEEIPCAFDLIASLHELENVAIIMSGSRMAKLPRDLGPFQYLKQLEFFVRGPCESSEDFFWILDIVMASPRLQKLFLTIKDSPLVACQRQRREHGGFSHNELKYVELCGYAGNINEIELASHFLKNVSSLKQITFNPYGRFYRGAGRWTESFHNYKWFSRRCNLIREMLKDEVNEQCQLIIL